MPRTIRNLDWNAPALPQVVRELVSLGVDDPEVLDLRGICAVVQSRQAERQVRLALARSAAESGRLLFPPAFEYPDHLFRGPEETRAASGGQSLMAWSEALRSADPDRYPRLFGAGGYPSGMDQRLGWAREFREIEDLLGENLLQFADVAASGKLPVLEVERWRELSRLEKRYTGILESWGLVSATRLRIDACAQPSWDGEHHTLVLVLLTDPLPAMVRFLESLQELSEAPRILVLNWGPETGDAFDPWGRPRPGFWLEENPPHPRLDERFHPARNLREESLLVAGLAGPNRDRPGVVSVGVQEGQVVAALKRRMDCFDPAGRPLATTSLYGLLQALRSWLETGRFADLIRMIRHPFIRRALESQLDGFKVVPVFREADTVNRDRLPDTVDDVERTGEDYPLLRPVLAHFREWERQLKTPPHDRALVTWLDAVAAAARNESSLLPEWQRWVELLPGILRSLEPCSLNSAEETLAAVLALAEHEPIYSEEPDAGIRLQGWLELALDEAPHLILTETADEYLPGATRAQRFLPDTLREALGLRNDRTRMTRDAWLLSCLDQSRRASGRLDFTLSRRNRSGEPLKPSRLLFLGPSESQPDRVALAFRKPDTIEEDPPWTPAWKLLPPGPDRRGLTWERISVTAFRDYLACPLRFYLKHGLKMETVDAGKLEWDAGEYGTLAHQALEGFARDPDLRDSEDPERIAEALTGYVERRAYAVYGSPLPLSLEIQLESLQQRLRAWAHHEAESRRAGWFIEPEGVEWKPPEGDERFLIQGVRVSGMIDRIERHADTGALRLLDFKTRDKRETPAAIHLKNWVEKRDADTVPEFAQVQLGKRLASWTDLQLPLYAWMVGILHPETPLEVGYVHLPKATGETGIETWDGFQDSGLLESALSCAESILMNIRNGIFWPPREKVKYDDFESLFFESALLDVDGSAIGGGDA